MAGTLFVVATPIGNLEDISARALRILRDVTVIAAEDTRHTAHLLQRFGLTTRTTSLHEHNEKGKAASLIEQLKAGADIALVSDAGTPGVSDPGAELVRRARQEGIRVEPVPGPSAVVAALSASGVGSDAFSFLGFPPSKGAARRAWIERLAGAGAIAPVAVFYEAPHRIATTLDELHARLGDLEIVVGREITKAHEEFTATTLAKGLAAPPRGEFTVVVIFGHTTTAVSQAVQATPAELATEFGVSTNKLGLTRRQAISALSRKYGLPARTVFAMLEKAKNSPV